MYCTKCTFATAILILTCCRIWGGEYDKSRREERALVYPQPSSEVRVITGIGLPVDLEEETVIIGTVLKGIYMVPSNSSLYTSPSITFARRKRRSISRWDVYKLLSTISDNYGHGGRPCILRAICEMADIPLDRSNGLFEELFHALLTPTATKEELSHHTDNEFYAAHQIGREIKGTCERFFSDCQISYVEMFTRLRRNNF